MEGDGSEELFWLHIPVEVAPDHRLTSIGRARVKIFGKSAEIVGTEDPRRVQAQRLAGYGLLFDPMSKRDAESLYLKLRERAPVLAYRMHIALSIPKGKLELSKYSVFNGPFPTLIPAELTPSAVWGGIQTITGADARGVFEEIESCEPVVEKRLRTALALWVTVEYEILPETKFLKLMTILDSLAVRVTRSPETKDWLDKKIEEIKALEGEKSPLVQGLGNLKTESIAAGLSRLVERAARQLGHSEDDIKASASLAVELYGGRSKLSHRGESGPIRLQEAFNLVRMVLDAAIKNPEILNPRKNEKN